MIDKEDIIYQVKNLNKIIQIELGSGENKKHKDAIGIDILNVPGVDLIGDIFEVLSELPDKCVNQIWAYHFLEHIDDLDRLMAEMSRICVDGAKIEIVVPHFSNPYFYSDPTHKRTFGLYSMSYFCVDEINRRAVPKYGKKPLFAILDAKIIFKSIRPRYIRHTIKKLFELFFNSNNWLKELYEELFCFIIPCYEIKYLLVKLKS
jgi:ubiquinone/menaquinone biosynthesis C-methylase UbiE